jgi:hypothetical protein
MSGDTGTVPIDCFPLDHYQRPGVYRRRVRIETRPGQARAELEDDPHRYGVTLQHHDRRVSAVEGRALRTPWSLCGEAVRMLDRLLGMPLSPDPQQVYRHSDGRAQCTHLVDLAGLALAHAARGIARRQYDIDVPCLDPASERQANLRVDGQLFLRWTLQQTRIVAPQAHAGQDLGSMMPWAKAQITDPDEFEAVIVLRRAVFTAGNRFYQMDRMSRASDTGHVVGACYVFQHGVADRALRRIGSTLDFSAGPDALLSDLEQAPG